MEPPYCIHEEIIMLILYISFHTLPPVLWRFYLLKLLLLLWFWVLVLKRLFYLTQGGSSPPQLALCQLWEAEPALQ